LRGVISKNLGYTRCPPAEPPGPARRRRAGPGPRLRAGYQGWPLPMAVPPSRVQYSPFSHGPNLVDFHIIGYVKIDYAENRLDWDSQIRVDQILITCHHGLTILEDLTIAGAAWLSCP